MVRAEEKESGMNKVLHAAGSLYAAVTIIILLASVLVLSTAFEAAYGSARAQEIFYGALWFDLLLGLLALNILCATLRRIPFQRRHIAFIATHAGILLLLAGALVARLFGQEGRMVLVEGQRQREMLQPHYQLELGEAAALSSAPSIVTDLREGGVVYADAEQRVLRVERVIERGAVQLEIKEGGDGAEANRAVHFSLSSAQMNFSRDFWLLDRNPYDPNSSLLRLGPALIELKPKARAREPGALPRLRLIAAGDGRVFEFEIGAGLPAELAVGASGYRVTDLAYYPNARVEENRLVNDEGAGTNPAVELTLVRPDGVKERHTRFALFPEFASMHGKAPSSSDFRIELIPPAGAGEAFKPVLTFIYDGDAWTYETRGESAPAALSAGAHFPVGWLDITAVVHGLLERAVVTRSVAADAPNGAAALQLALYAGGREADRGWLLSGETLSFSSGGKRLTARFRPAALSVPFELELSDFRKIDYPGSTRPASYESDVRLHDPGAGLTLSRTIRMNEPLDYAGYRIFQSSYSQDEMGRDISVFTVARNPGIRLIYAGCIVMFIGVMLLFYAPPLSTLARPAAGGV